MKTITVVLSLLIILFFREAHTIENIDVDIAYPLTPPGEFSKGIENWKYEESEGCFFSPLFSFIAESDRDFNYNTALETNFTCRNISHTISAMRRKSSIYDSTTIDLIGTSFHYKEDSVSLQYRNSSWFNLKKEILTISSYAIAEKQEYIGEVSMVLNHFHRKNAFNLRTHLHKPYGYASMLTLSLNYDYSPYLIKKRTVQILITDRFAYEDYLFFIPGIRGTFISQIFFTPFIRTKYLINKNISVEALVEGISSETNLKKPLYIQYIAFPESLETPENIMKVWIGTNIIVDTCFRLRARGCIRKTKNPILNIEKTGYSLSYSNLDTTITFSSLLFDVTTSLGILTWSSQLSLNFTPFYEKKIPYFTPAKLSADISLHPFERFSFSNNIQYFGRTYDREGKEMGTYYILSSSIDLMLSRNIFLKISILNILNNKERFLGDVHYPGRLITSGIMVIF